MGIVFAAYTKVPGRKEDNLVPGIEMYQTLQAEMEKLIILRNKGLPVLNSEKYLRLIPEYLVFNRIDTNQCDIGSKMITIDEQLKLYPCQYMPPIADLRHEDLAEVWFSEKIEKERHKMIKGNCKGCISVCYKDEPNYIFG